MYVFLTNANHEMCGHEQKTLWSIKYLVLQYVDLW